MPHSQIVMADAQFGSERFLRPNPEFTTSYAGGVPAATNPIWLFPNGKPLDPNAGEPGYDPNLINGLSVPVGARLIVKIPTLLYQESTDPIVLRSYIWAFIWRERNLFDYRTQRIPWHLPTSEGPDDTSGATPQPRVVLPAATNTIVYNQAEPTSATLPDSLRAVQRARADDIRFSMETLNGPLLPGAVRGVVQQGVLDPDDFPSLSIQQAFMSHEMQALEDELLIAVYRDTGPVDWDFTVPGGTDQQLAELLGDLGRGAGGLTQRVGVYVKSGTGTGPKLPRTFAT